VRDVDVFLFDEPLSNLDAKLRSELRVEIKRLHQKLANTMIYVTHDQIEAMTLADRIAVMKGGLIQQLGRPQDIYRRPTNRFVAGFIGSPGMNFLDGEVKVQDGAPRFVAEGADRTLLAADYSQIELRILAHIAGEEALVESFRRGEDIHRTTAAAVLGVAPELVNSEQRRAAKTINFGIIYGMSAYGLSQTLHIPPKEAERFIAAYLERYPGVRRYMDETLAAAEAEGGVATLWGRVRWLPDITSKNWNLRENARRMAINARIQGTAADFMKKAMIEVDRRLRAEAPEARLLLTVHDELVLEVPEADAERVAELVRTEMAGVADLAVPLVVDAGWGRSWYEAKE